MSRIARGIMFVVAITVVRSVTVLAGDVSSHAPIVISSDADFASCRCVKSGAGTTDSPYVIGPWSLTSTGGDAVTIDGETLTKSFVLFNLTVTGNSSSIGRGIVLSKINPSGTQSIIAKVAGTQTSIQNNAVGILVQSSNYVTLDGGGANPNGAGVTNKAGTINQNTAGAIDLENSSHITVTGWQMSASGLDHQPDYVTLDPSVANWGIGGVRMVGVTTSLVDHNAANNCTSISYSLFNSSHNTVSNNTADYPFVSNFIVTDGSSYNLLTGNVASTGDFFGIIVADPLPGTWTLATYGAAHDNVISNNISHTDGPTGNEIKGGVVPAFLGGIAILNGTYDNQILNNQDWSSTGGDLVWAQVVPDTSTPIGVATYPPTLHCNVTASEGGGGVANHNGNIWTGNSAVLVDACIPAQ